MVALPQHVEPFTQCRQADRVCKVARVWFSHRMGRVLLSGGGRQGWGRPVSHGSTFVKRLAVRINHSRDGASKLTRFPNVRTRTALRRAEPEKNHSTTFPESVGWACQHATMTAICQLVTRVSWIVGTQTVQVLRLQGGGVGLFGLAVLATLRA